jgi:hypothetical protein
VREWPFQKRSVSSGCVISLSLPGKGSIELFQRYELTARQEGEDVQLVPERESRRAYLAGRSRYGAELHPVLRL